MRGVTKRSACRICGGLVESTIPANWHPSKLASRIERDMRQHLRGHSFAEVLRFEIRQDLDQVPDEERPTILRDIYRNLLGRTDATGGFKLNDPDGRGVYSIDEVLGQVAMYHMWRSASRCGQPGCAQH
jgi:hypothetical protein